MIVKTRMLQALPVFSLAVFCIRSVNWHSSVSWQGSIDKDELKVTVVFVHCWHPISA